MLDAAEVVRTLAQVPQNSQCLQSVMEIIPGVMTDHNRYIKAYKNMRIVE